MATILHGKNKGKSGENMFFHIVLSNDRTYMYGGQGEPPAEGYFKIKLPTDIFCYPSTEQEYNASLPPTEAPRDPVGDLATQQMIMERFSKIIETYREITHLADTLAEPLRSTIINSIIDINGACTKAFEEIERCNAVKK